MEVLNRSTIPRLDVPAGCASQGAMKLLGVEQNPRHKRTESERDVILAILVYLSLKLLCWNTCTA